MTRTYLGELRMSANRNRLLSAARRLRGGVIAAALLLPLWVHADIPAYSSVTNERLLNAQQDNGWLMYRRNYESTGYAPFDQINGGTVGKLAIAFDYTSDLSQGHE